jgi:probable F420-dependent oxidoreductase
MKFGLALPAKGENCRRDLLVEAAQTAEEMGFDSIWIWDHYVTPSSRMYFDAWILLSHLAAVTSRIKLGTLVTPIPFRPPAILAKMVASVDVLSGGRVILGAGAGWSRAEFEGYSRWEDNATRVDKTREGLQLILKLWSEQQVDFKGRFYSAKGDILEPKPVQKPHPPIWFGTVGNRMLKMAAVYGDGWIPVFISAEEYRETRERLLRNLKAAGRSSEEMVFAFCDNKFSTVEARRSGIEAYHEAGCEYYVALWDIGEQQSKTHLKQYVSDVLSSFR